VPWFENGMTILQPPPFTTGMCQSGYGIGVSRTADFRSYVDCQLAVNDAYKDQERWSRMSILNTARIGKFSSDRAIREYCEDIWAVEPVALGV